MIAHNQAKEGSETQETAQRGLTLLCNFPESYHGISYEKIVEALIQYHGGTPEVGERHARIITLANDLRYITDSNADWLMQIVPNFDKPDYEKARDGFEQEEIFARVSVKSPLDLVGNTFTKEELEKAMKANGFKSNVSSYISTLKGKSRNKIVETATHQYRKI